jgi:short-chain fatty acids transporter
VKGADYRAVGAAAYLGVGSIWALGLSSSAALIMATPTSLPQSIAKISGIIPVGQTLGLWQSMVMAAVLLAVSLAITYYSAPTPTQARSMQEMGVTYAPPALEASKPDRPGEWLEYSPLLTVLASVLGFSYLAMEVSAKGLSILLDLNHYIFAFLIIGLLLHWRPRSFVRAIAGGVPSAAGVLIQYPLYAGIVKMMTESGLAKMMARSSLKSPPHTPSRCWWEFIPLCSACSFLRRAANGSSKRPIFSMPEIHCMFTLAGSCKPTTPLKRWRI